MECGNRLRVGVRAKNAVACRGLRVGPSKTLCPQSPRAKFLRNVSKRSAKNPAKFWRNFSQIFVLQFPGKVGARKFTKNPRHFPRCTKLSFFTAASLGASGPNKTQIFRNYSQTISLILCRSSLSISNLCRKRG